MSIVIQFGVPAMGAFIFSLLLIPFIKKAGIRMALIDKPNARKVHTESVPLVGGIAVAITTAMALMISPRFFDTVRDNITWLSGALIMLVVGALDDRFNIKPSYRLLIQLFCAYAVAASGIRVNSLYGLFGLADIPLVGQYVLTIVVITGVVNAYNLMDGIDGLLGGLTFVGASVLGIISYQLRQYELTILYLAIIGSVIGFLRHNLSTKKIFMGDAGSLFLGFILVVTAIKLLNVANRQSSVEQLKVLLLISGIFLVPVLDSLRVYRARVKKGVSPFKADKTHLHHLFLFLGITHKKATVLIIILVILIMMVVAGLIYLIPVTWVIVIGLSIFIAVTTLLSINRSVQEWKEKLKRMEHS